MVNIALINCRNKNIEKHFEQYGHKVTSFRSLVKLNKSKNSYRINNQLYDYVIIDASEVESPLLDFEKHEKIAVIGLDQPILNTVKDFSHTTIFYDKLQIILASNTLFSKQISNVLRIILEVIAEILLMSPQYILEVVLFIYKVYLFLFTSLPYQHIDMSSFGLQVLYGNLNVICRHISEFREEEFTHVIYVKDKHDKTIFIDGIPFKIDTRNMFLNIIPPQTNRIFLLTKEDHILVKVIHELIKNSYSAISNEEIAHYEEYNKKKLRGYLYERLLPIRLLYYFSRYLFHQVQ